MKLDSAIHEAVPDRFRKELQPAICLDALDRKRHLVEDTIEKEQVLVDALDGSGLFVSELCELSCPRVTRKPTAVKSIRLAEKGCPHI